MFEKMLNRILLGTATPMGKIIAVLMTVVLTGMIWDSRMISVAYAAETAPAAESQVVDVASSAQPAPVEASSQPVTPTSENVTLETSAVPEFEPVVENIEQPQQEAVEEPAKQPVVEQQDENLVDSKNITDNDVPETSIDANLVVASDDETYVIHVYANSAEYEYDGNKHGVSGFEELTFEVEESIYTVSGLATTDPSAITSGEYSNEIIGTPVVKDSSGVDVTKKFTVYLHPGMLNIQPKEASIVVDNASKVLGAEDPAFTGTVTGLVNEGDLGTITYYREKGKEEAEAVGVYEGVLCADYTQNSNYNVTVTKGTFTITDENVVVITVTGNSETVPYDGKSHSVSGYTVSVPKGYGLTKDDVVGPREDETVVSGTSVIGAPKGDGVYSMGLSAEDFSVINNDGDYKVSFNVTDGGLTIAPAPLTVTAKDQIYTYNGNPHGDFGTYTTAIAGKVRVEGLVGEDTLTSVVLNGEQKTEIGKYVGEIIPANAAVGDATGNYDIEYAPGTLTITEDGIGLTVDYYVGAYDGKPHGVNAYTRLSDATIYYSLTSSGSDEDEAGSDWKTEPPTWTEASSDTHVVYIKAECPGHETEYTVGFVTINRAPIVIKALKTETYDGAKKTLAITGDDYVNGLAEGDTLTFSGATISGIDQGIYTQLDAGEGGSPAYTWSVFKADGTDNTASYDLEVSGTLTIEAANVDQLGLKVQGYDGVYDGQPHTVTVNSDKLPEETTVTFSTDRETWSETAPTWTDVTTVPQTVYVRAENPNYQTADASATVFLSPRSVVFIGKSETKDYTGETISIDTVALEEGRPDSGLISGHTHNVVFSASGVEAGEYPGTITAADDVVIKSGSEDVTNNYSITTKSGTLTVSKATSDLTVELEGASFVYDGKTHALLAAAATNASSGVTTIEYAKAVAEGESPAWTTDFASLTATNVADSCTIQVRATNPNYSNTAETSADLTITARPVTFTGETGSKSYIGSDIELTGVSANEGESSGLVDGHTSNVVYSATGLNVGVYDGVITAADDVVIKSGDTDVTPNYSVTTEAGKLTITQSEAPMPVTFEDKTFVYDAEPHALEAATTGAVSGTTTFEYSKNGISWTPNLASLTATDVADSCTIQVRATNPNYSNATTKSAKLAISKRFVRFEGHGEIRSYTGETQTINAIDMTGDGLLEGHMHNVGFSASGVEAGTYVGPITPAAEVAIMSGEANVTANYEIATAPGTLVIGQSAEELAVSLEGKSFVYDGESHALTADATTNAKTGTTKIEYSKDGSTWTTDLSGLTATNVADSCTIQVRATNPNYRNTATASAELTIKARPVTFAGGTATKIYSGSELMLVDVTPSKGDYEGLLRGHTHNVEFIARGVEVGRYDGTITPKEDVVIMAGAVDVTANYDITVENGWLIISGTEEELTVSLESGTYVYNGAPQSLQKGATSNATSGVTTYEYSKDGKTWTSDLSAVTATTVNDSCTVMVRATNPNYLRSATSSATLTITKRPVEFVGVSETKDYTGSEITINSVNASATVEGEGLVNGHAHNVEFRARGTEVGQYTGTITAAKEVVITADGVDVTENYDVSTTAGTLTIQMNEARELTVNLQGQSYVYDGNPHALPYAATTNASDGVTTIEYSFDEGGAYVNNLASLTKVDAGTYTVYVRAKNPGYANEATGSAVLTIAPRPVAFTGEAATRAYTGSEIRIDGLTVSSGANQGLVSGHAHNVTYSASGTEAGEYDGSITAASDVVITAGGADVTANYRITVANGKLVIDPTAGVFYVQLQDSLYSYDGQPKALASSPTNTARTGETAYTYSFSADGPYVADLSSLTKTNVGEYTVYVRAVNPNYAAVATTTATLIIDPKPVTITVNDASKVYGQADPAFTGTVTGLVNDGDLGAVVYSRTGDDRNVGTYANVLGATYTPNANYTVSVAKGDLTIEQASVTVAANAASKVVGTTDPAFAATVTGLVGSDTVQYMVYRPGAGVDEAVGTYANAIVPVGTVSQGNYILSFVPAAFEITAATPTDGSGSSNGATPSNRGDTTPGGTTPASGGVSGGTVPGGAGTGAGVTPITTASINVIPDAGAGGAAAPAAAGAQGTAQSPEMIGDNDTPLAETVDDNSNPLAGGLVGNTWSLFDLAATIIAAALSIIMLIGLGRKRDVQDALATQGDSVAGFTYGSIMMRIASLAPAVVSVVMFVLTQDLTGIVTTFDTWSFPFGLFAVANVALMAVLYQRDRRNQSDPPGSQQAGMTA